MTNTPQLTTIGRAEKILLSALIGNKPTVTAKVDTGADISSLWASDIHESDTGLHFKVFGPSSPHYTGKTIFLPKGDYNKTRVANSFGQREIRFSIRTPVRLAGRRVLATFTLSDRSSKTYPILLGRRLLRGKFTVNVAQGKPLRNTEKAKRERMKLELEANHRVS